MMLAYTRSRSPSFSISSSSPLPLGPIRLPIDDNTKLTAAQYRCGQDMHISSACVVLNRAYFHTIHFPSRRTSLSFFPLFYSSIHPSIDNILKNREKLYQEITNRRRDSRRKDQQRQRRATSSSNLNSSSNVSSSNLNASSNVNSSAASNVSSSIA